MSEQLSQPIRLEVSALKAVNYALHAGGVSIVRTVGIFNDSDQALDNVTLRFWAEPALILPYSRHYDRIGPGACYRAGPLELTLDGSYLCGLTEKVTGLLHYSLEQEDQVLWAGSQELTALAFDEWHGSGIYPELLASFITPNHPEIAPLIARAAELLGTWTGDPSLDAYQTQDPNRVMQQAAAVYAALQERNIIYAVPPASFEHAGQRVRLCDTILQQKMGTCLDLTLLYCGCLEAMGLHPLLVLQSNHIFAGVWLEELTFPETVQDDAALITKRLASGVGELAVVECTAFCAGKEISFDLARTSAEKSLQKGLEYIIDVHRARLSGVTPLPQRISTENGWEVLRPDLPETQAAAPQQMAAPIDVSTDEPEAVTKKVQWERKLLDLGLRNNLINMRLRKNTVPILTVSIDELEDTLASGSDFTIHPKPADYQSGSMTFESIGELQGNEALIRSEFQNKRLRAPFTDTELTKALKELYRSSRASLEENGANTLYLALGLLRWYETAKSTKARYAPLVLLPIEIVRKSSRVGYVIRLRDEEPQMNVTLLEMLKQDHKILVTGLDPLPADDQGVDLRKVLTVMRKAVMNQPRWDVLESAYLGIFSFSQFVMWNDIRNRSANLEKNKLVRSLMDGKLSWEAQEMGLPGSVPEDGVFLPMAADASQLFAIEKANEGESFVLHGPPGTGKSQTITSLIANALAQGKTVLFVAEKMAALEVVQRRLAKIGLGPFCLELHSNKSKKRDVLEQLRQATEVTKTTTPAEFALKAEDIGRVRQELNAYAQALHAPQNCGRSLFDLVNLYESNRTAPDLAPFPEGLAESCTAPAWNARDLAAQRLVAAAKAVGHPQGHPLSCVGRRGYSQQLRLELNPTLSACAAATEALGRQVRSFCGANGLDIPQSREELARTAALADLLAPWYDLPQVWAQDPDPRQTLKDAAELARRFQAANQAAQDLCRVWDPEILTRDAKAMLAQWDGATGKWFLGRVLEQNKLLRQWNILAKTPFTAETIRDQLRALQDQQAKQTSAEAMLQTHRACLGTLYDYDRTDWSQVLDLVDRTQTALDALGSQPQADRLRRALPEQASLDALKSAWNQFTQAQERVTGLLDLGGPQSQEGYLAGLRAQIENITSHASSLKDWMAWNDVAANALDLGLDNLVAAYRDGMAHEDVVPAFHKALARELASRAIDAEPCLGRFSGPVFNETVRQFKRLDEELMKLTQQEIFCHLAARIPNFTKEAAHSSELGILQRAIRSGGRGVSIRNLFEQLPNLLPRLCPCMLMSPISAAQYLEPNRAPFDLVVFDEASQLPTCKAVGALARGENAVVVGDPKQMPPTAFFATNTVDEDNLDSEDLESILDDCLALNIPQTHLLWHYRSRHESLIAYSNSRFYENKLYTFPSVNDRETKVTLVHVDGVFERGKNRQNKAEAQAIVEELKRRCHDETLSKQSVGVVTFNISQQNLIDDLLSEACREDQALEAWAYHSEEPLFIKNLENVQGDERDVILFSICYGPDEKGKVYMNFGPLNRDGGWRRLNVAITRARQEMTVFATLRPDQIDLGRSAAEGVSALKGFLEYAQGGVLPLTETMARKEPDIPGIAQAICAWLKTQGYDSQTNVGHSQYRIDIGVVDPEAPDRYKLGILLDGGSYRTARTARDREIAQIGVLEGLGWRIHRIWTMDWWDNREAELKNLLEVLNREPEPDPEDPIAEEPPAEASNSDPQPPKLAQGIGTPLPQELLVYAPTKLRASTVEPENLLLSRYESNLRRKLTMVLAQEAPISEGLLLRRVLQSYGVTRCGTRLQAHIQGILGSMDLLTTTYEGRVFYWNPDQDPAEYTQFRISDAEENRRDAKDLPIQEAANALCHVLSEQIGMAREDLIREAAKLLGYARLGANMTAAFASALEYAETKGRITQAPNGNFTLTNA